MVNVDPCFWHTGPDPSWVVLVTCPVELVQVRSIGQGRPDEHEKGSLESRVYGMTWGVSTSFHSHGQQNGWFIRENPI